MLWGFQRKRKHWSFDSFFVNYAFGTPTGWWSPCLRQETSVKFDSIFVNYRKVLLGNPNSCGWQQERTWEIRKTYHFARFTWKIASIIHQAKQQNVHKFGNWFSDCSSISIAPSVFSSKEGFRHECYAMQGRLFFAPLLPALGSSWLGSCQAKMNSILGIQAYETFLRHEEVDVFFLCFFSNASCIHCWPKCFCYSSTRSNMLFLVLQTDYFP